MHDSSTRPNRRTNRRRAGRLELRLFLQLVPLVIYELQQDTVQRLGVDEGELTIPEGTGPSDERIPLFLQLLHGLPRVVHVEADQHDALTVLLYVLGLSLIHISEPTRLRRISYAVFCLKK